MAQPLEDGSQGFDFLKLIPLILVWAIAYILDSTKSSRKRKTQPNDPSSVSDSYDRQENDQNAVLQEWRKGVFKEQNEDDLDLEEDESMDEEYSEEEKSPQIHYEENKKEQAPRFSSIEERQFSSAIESRNINSAIESRELHNEMSHHFSFTTEFDSDVEHEKSRSSLQKKGILVKPTLPSKKKQLLLSQEILNPPVAFRIPRI